MEEDEEDEDEEEEGKVFVIEEIRARLQSPDTRHVSDAGQL